jgi:outer membrane receptor protein involved in Fe transport
LFATGVTTQTVLADPAKGTSYQIPQVTTGSRNLTPEVADTTSGGFVIQPHAVPGLSASLDYFSITINNAITTPAAQVILNQCAAGDAQACLAVTRSPTTGLITGLAITPLNIQSETTAGFDFAVNYQRALDTLSSHLAGVVAFQALATETFDHTVNLLGTAIQYAGTNGDGAFADPRWRGEVSSSYALGRFSGSFVVQYIGSGVISNKTPFIVNNSVPAIAYLDLSGSYKLASGLEFYGVIDNLFNKSPPATPQVTTTPHINVGVDSYIYDTIGRQFRVGFRFKL